MNILFLTHRLPFARNRGDRIRAWYLLREMSRFADVSVFSLLHDDEEEAALDRVPFARRVAGARIPHRRNAVRGALSLLSERPLTLSLLDAPSVHDGLARFAPDTDLVVALCSSMGRFALEPPLAHLPLAVDLIDVDSVKWQEQSERTRGPLRHIYAREARTLAAFEARLARRAGVTLVVNDREREAIARLAPDAAIEVMEVGVELDDFVPPSGPIEEPVVVFCGVMNYGPNDTGVREFIDSVWPLVRRQVPAARFLVVGANPTEALTAKAKADPSITVTGRVERVQPHLWSGAVSVAPLSLARGVQNKVLEAIVAGLPAVVSEAVLGGLPSEVRPACDAYQRPEDGAAAICRLLVLTGRERRARAALANMEPLRWENRLKRLESLLTDVVRRQRPAAARNETRTGVSNLS